MLLSPQLCYNEKLLGQASSLPGVKEKEVFDVTMFLLRVSVWEHHQHSAVVRVTHHNKVRLLGYKAKHGFLIYRVRVRCGGRKTPLSKGIVYGKPTNQGVTQLKFKRSKRYLVEEHSRRKLGGLRVLSSY